MKIDITGGTELRGLSFRSYQDGFDLGFKGRLVIRHRKRKPFLLLGRGTAEYLMSHGNFRMHDRIEWMRPCRDFSIEASEARGQSAPELRLQSMAPRVSLECRVEDGRLILGFHDADPGINRFRLRLACAPGEHFYGCGEQFSRLDLAGSRVPLWTSEQGVGRGHDPITLYANLHSHSGGSWHTTYFPQPAFTSSGNWYCAVDASAYGEIDFRKRGEVRIGYREVPSRIAIGGEGTAVECIRGLTRYMGIQPRLPDWVFDGMWLGVQGGRDRVEAKLKDARAAGVRVSALWAQDWEGKRETAFGRQLMWNWEYDRKLYPDLPEWIASLRERGVRLLGYINPFLAVEGSLYHDASKRGFCVKHRSGGDYLIVVTTFPAALLDLTNPEAVSWVKDVIKENMIGIGLSGWMADYGEYLPTDAVLHSGEPAELVHNRYPALWARANYEAVEEAGRLGEVAFFMRAGFTGSARYSPVFWAGDQLVNWSRHDGLPSVIPAGISLGMGGAGIWHSDIGGFTTLAWIRRRKELFLRWAEMAAFTPIMRTHEGNRPDSNWQFNSDGETLAHLARMTRIYAALKPYNLHLIEEYAGAGIPPIRHPFIHAENDPRLHGLKDQYLYGSDLMVAPVVRPGRLSRRVYLPESRWIHLWSGREYRGGRHRVPAALGEPPVFYRTESPFAELFKRIGRDEGQH